jgi:hypothetical protein
MEQSDLLETRQPQNVQAQPVTAQEAAIGNLLQVAEPLMAMWTKNDNEKHQREMEYANNVLLATTKQNRLMTIGLFALLALVFVDTGILFVVGRDSTAMALIQLVFGLGGAVLGGYGWAKVRRGTRKQEE